MNFSRRLLFKARNGLFQPLPDSFLEFGLMSLPFEGANRLPFRIQRDEVAGDCLVKVWRGNHVDQAAFHARPGAPRVVEINAGGGIQEDGRSFPGGAWGLVIASALQEGEFTFQHFEEITVVAGHGALRANSYKSQIFSLRRAPAAYDPAHSRL